MAKNMLKNYGRFELLELIYNMRKENLELRERCEAAERRVTEIRMQTEKQLDYARRSSHRWISSCRICPRRRKSSRWRSRSNGKRKPGPQGRMTAGKQSKRGNSHGQKTQKSRNFTGPERD